MLRPCCRASLRIGGRAGGSAVRLLRVVSGLSVATIIGVPVGTLLAQHAGWQAAFWAVALITALSAVALLIALPGGRDTTAAQPHLGTEPRSLRVPRLWVAYATTALSVAPERWAAP